MGGETALAANVNKRYLIIKLKGFYHYYVYIFRLFLCVPCNGILKR